MGDQTHIIELIDQVLNETQDLPQIQEKIFDLRDALFQAQQSAQQYALKIKTLEEALEKLKSPAHRIGTILAQGENDLVRLVSGGTEYQAAVVPELMANEGLKTGDQVALNEGFVAIARLPFPTQGPLAKISGKLAGGQWLVQVGTGNTETIVLAREGLNKDELKEGEEIFLDNNQRVILGKIAKRESRTLIEDDYDQVEWSQVGGQEKVKEEVRKVLEYPLLHKEILSQMEYQTPKGFLFYGPPGCGKTFFAECLADEVGFNFMKISVVIPTYNRANFLKECLESILRQKLLPYEVIVVDDGSTDGTKQVIKKLSTKVDRVIYHGKNRGKGAAIQSASKFAKGELIIIQDADLEYDPRDLKKIVNELIQYSNPNNILSSKKISDII